MSVFVILGTRPEAIKLAPVIHSLKKNLGSGAVKVVSTAQHRQMLDQVLGLFDIVPDFDLDVMVPNQNLNSLCAQIIAELNQIFIKEKPMRVVVQGDTTTCFAGAVAAFHLGIAVDHVEAGLRTGDLSSPFPEEMNRRYCDLIADQCYAATKMAADALMKEGVKSTKIHVTGNTVIDALLMTKNIIEQDEALYASVANRFSFLSQDKKLLLVTGHRRESFGSGIRNMCQALVTLSQTRPDIEIVYPVHLNPNVRQAVEEIIKPQSQNIHLIEPQDYQSFIYLMNRSYIILSDSGGIQEEAPSLNRPLLVTRDNSERMEAMASGVAKLVGTDTLRIVQEVTNLLDNSEQYQAMALAQNPFGDGSAAEKIVKVIQDKMLRGMK